PYGSVKEWPRKDARIVVHTGDTVWVVKTDVSPAQWTRHSGGVRIGDYVYCRTIAEDPVAETAIDDVEAHDLISFYRCWNIPETAEVLGVRLVGFLLFGWLCSAFVPGLLKHRPTL